MPISSIANIPTVVKLSAIPLTFLSIQTKRAPVSPSPSPPSSPAPVLPPALPPSSSPSPHLMVLVSFGFSHRVRHLAAYSTSNLAGVALAIRLEDFASDEIAEERSVDSTDGTDARRRRPSDLTVARIVSGKAMGTTMKTFCASSTLGRPVAGLMESGEPQTCPPPHCIPKHGIRRLKEGTGCCCSVARPRDHPDLLDSSAEAQVPCIDSTLATTNGLSIVWSVESYIS
ncbi:hypothetical protein R3P38DRAFT_3271244 [Favolaschia claudopus]|uniref:Uncharacterized protein n=1 Tax=Favolaschia claudopus TaxID=2862362 RepID=A0AAW0B936_9AGAR